MARYDRTDLKLTVDGDLVLGPDGDLATVSQLEYQVQQALSRVKSITVDWLHDHIGADLEDLLGAENTRETGEEFKRRVKTSLMQGGFLGEEDIYMEVVPVGTAKLVMFLFLNSPHAAEPVGFEVDLDLAAGAKIRPV